ncbi:hypothetical protein M514_01083, partial [Trichuris suis]
CWALFVHTKKQRHLYKSRAKLLSVRASRLSKQFELQWQPNSRSSAVNTQFQKETFSTTDTQSTI